ncbi:hypothetical protein GEMRC1_013575 [Eukaryota sp. GEM-RC1]
MKSITGYGNNIAGFQYDEETRKTSAIAWGQCWGKEGILAGCDGMFVSEPVPLGCLPPNNLAKSVSI